MKICTGISRVFSSVYGIVHDGEVRLRDPRLDLVDRNPTGFAWGYGGSGPSQLALALLADVYDDQTALGAHQAFKWTSVAKLPQNQGWEITEDEIRRIVTRIGDD
jgi:hypothetical protein